MHNVIRIRANIFKSTGRRTTNSLPINAKECDSILKKIRAFTLKEGYLLCFSVIKRTNKDDLSEY